MPSSLNWQCQRQLRTNCLLLQPPSRRLHSYKLCVRVFTCSYPALLLLRVLLALLERWPFLHLQPLQPFLPLQPLEWIRWLISWRFLYGDHRHHHSIGGLLFGPPPLFRAPVIIIVSAIAVTHVVKTKVFDFITGAAICAVGAVLLLLDFRVLEAKQVQLTVLLRLGVGLPGPAARTWRNTALIFCC